MKWQPLLLLLTLSTFNTATHSDTDKLDTDKPLVVIKDFKFIPQEITIKRGQSITWENQEKRQYHNAWFEALGEEEPDYIFPDETYDREFKKTGNFPYRCGPHPKMTGTVHVTE